MAIITHTQKFGGSIDGNSLGNLFSSATWNTAYGSFTATVGQYYMLLLSALTSTAFNDSFLSGCTILGGSGALTAGGANYYGQSTVVIIKATSATVNYKHTGSDGTYRNCIKWCQIP